MATVDFLNISTDAEGTDADPVVQPSNQPEWFKETPETGAVAGIAKGKYEAKGGTSGDIVITVWDSLENKSVLKGLDGHYARRKYPGDQTICSPRTRPRRKTRTTRTRAL